jgi:RimJ/RimL family protein N-acetyltransferase
MTKLGRPPTKSQFQIRSATASDSAQLLGLKLALDRETKFMMLEPGERIETADEVALHLQAISTRENSVILLAEEAGRLIGYVEAQGGQFRRNRHAAQIVIGVRQDASGRGIGTALLGQLSEWALRHKVHRLELTVMAHNQRAIALYRKNGYEVEGTRRHAIRIAGSDIDELAMAKLAFVDPSAGGTERTCSSITGPAPITPTASPACYGRRRRTTKSAGQR